MGTRTQRAGWRLPAVGMVMPNRLSVTQLSMVGPLHSGLREEGSRVLRVGSP